MKINSIITCCLLTALASCSAPKPSDQDGSILWLANSRPYEEILSSVETRVDGTLAKEGYRIFDEAGKRVVAGGSEAGVRYGVYALQRAEVLGKAGPGMDLQEKPRAVVITFIDSGIPYNPLAKEDPDVSLSAEERSIGGLGIFMVKKTMDKMEYEYTDKQNILKMYKNIE